jgi:hypothetical protein
LFPHVPDVPPGSATTHGRVPAVTERGTVAPSGPFCDCVPHGPEFRATSAPGWFTAGAPRQSPVHGGSRQQRRSSTWGHVHRVSPAGSGTRGPHLRPRHRRE